MCDGSSTGNLVQRRSTPWDSLFMHKPYFPPSKLSIKWQRGTVDDNIMRVQHVRKWCRQSERGQMDIHDEYCTRWPSTQKEVNAAQVEELLLGQWTNTWKITNTTVIQKWTWLFKNSCKCKRPISNTHGTEHDRATSHKCATAVTLLREPQIPPTSTTLINDNNSSITTKII